MMIKNSMGKVYYGMHFYPGVAEYADAKGKDPYRIFINEDTIRSMSPSFAGRPIFVEHVDEVHSDVDELRKEADGWVVESFYNQADGKTWAKFLVCSDAGEKAIKNGFKLSNAYIPKAFGPGGLWNGVSYAKEVTVGEFEHLAIVRNPRYEESRILTPEEFKQYNAGKELELKKLANSKDEEETTGMAFNLFKKTKVENTSDISGMSVVLPKSKVEVSIEKLINDADDVAVAGPVAAPAATHAPLDSTVTVDGVEMTVSELIEKYILSIKPVETAPVVAPPLANEEKEEPKKEEPKKKENEETEEEKKKKLNNFDSLKNAHVTDIEEVAKVELSSDQLARGKSRYGSN